MHATQNPATDTVTTPTPDTGTVSRTLRDAALYLSRHGWTQGAYYDQTATCFTPAACLVGAVGMVCYGGPVDAPALNYTDPGYLDFATALDVVEEQVGYTNPDPEHADVYGYNDAPGRTAAEVIATLRAAADRWEQRHPAHADYPHHPGTLYDCPACESTCHCADGFVCIRCSQCLPADGDTTTGGAA